MPETSKKKGAPKRNERGRRETVPTQVQEWGRFTPEWETDINL